jgi:hypothetical protein
MDRNLKEFDDKLIELKEQHENIKKILDDDLKYKLLDLATKKVVVILFREYLFRVSKELDDLKEKILIELGIPTENKNKINIDLSKFTDYIKNSKKFVNKRFIELIMDNALDICNDDKNDDNFHCFCKEFEELVDNFIN